MLARVFLSLLLMVCLSQCAGGGGSYGSGRGGARWRPSRIPGRTAVLYPNGKAWLPANAPIRVHNAIAAANRIAGRPYVWGGGHARLEDRGYDCSGAVSYVLNYAGVLRGCGTSDAFRRFGQAGRGEWITVYAKDGHTFLEIAGLRFDTGSRGNDRSTGPHWTLKERSLSGFRARHPSGL